MALKAIYEKLDEVPEHFHELYTEKNGKFELSGIEGIKTDADFQRVHSGLTKERNDHKETKAKLAAWGDLKFEDVRAQLDSIDELKARADAASDPTKNQQAIEAAVVQKTRPLERTIEEIKGKLDQANKALESSRSKERMRAIHDAVRAAKQASKYQDLAEPDVLLNAERMLDAVPDELDPEKFNVVTRDGVGVTPGVDVNTWLMEMQPKRPLWWPESTGGGAKGGNGNGGSGGKNPWSAEHWNMTEQGRFLTQFGEARAESHAKAAGTTLGGPRPAPRK